MADASEGSATERAAGPAGLLLLLQPRELLEKQVSAAVRGGDAAAWRALRATCKPLCGLVDRLPLPGGSLRVEVRAGADLDAAHADDPMLAAKLRLLSRSVVRELDLDVVHQCPTACACSGEWLASAVLRLGLAAHRRLTHLRLAFAGHTCTDLAFRPSLLGAIAEACPQLQHLSVVEDGQFRVIATGSPAEWRAAWAAAPASLSGVTLRRLPPQTVELVCPLPHRAVSELHLEVLGGISDAAPRLMAGEVASALRSLQLQAAHPVRNAGALLQRTPRLRVFKTDHVSIRSDDMHELLALLPELETLVLGTPCFGELMDAVPSLPNMPRLKEARFDALRPGAAMQLVACPALAAAKLTVTNGIQVRTYDDFVALGGGLRGVSGRFGGGVPVIVDLDEDWDRDVGLPDGASYESIQELELGYIFPICARLLAAMPDLERLRLTYDLGLAVAALALVLGRGARCPKLQVIEVDVWMLVKDRRDASGNEWALTGKDVERAWAHFRKLLELAKQRRVRVRICATRDAPWLARERMRAARALLGMHVGDAALAGAVEFAPVQKLRF